MNADESKSQLADPTVIAKNYPAGNKRRSGTSTMFTPILKKNFKWEKSPVKW